VVAVVAIRLGDGNNHDDDMDKAGSSTEDGAEDERSKDQDICDRDCD